MKELRLSKEFLDSLEDKEWKVLEAILSKRMYSELVKFEKMAGHVWTPQKDLIIRYI